MYIKVCEQPGLNTESSRSFPKKVFKRMNIDNPTLEQEADAEKKAREEHGAILFIIGADKHMYSKLIEDMKDDMLRKKDYFPKTIAEA